MADSSTSNPKPRPRPKPIRKQHVKPVSSATPDAPSSSSPTKPSSKTASQRVNEIDDIDRMFIRNTNRSDEVWQKLDKLDRATRIEKKESSDTDDATTPRKGYKHKRKKQEVVHSQPWQDPKQLTRILSEDLSDSDVELVGESPSADIKPYGKRKREQRSRSRSITPPPALSTTQIQIAKNLVREALRAAPRRASPTMFDEDEYTENIVLQPELRAIAQEIKKQPERFSSQAPEPSGEDNIDVSVRWNPHPLNQHPSKPVWDFQMSRADTFRDLFEAVAEEAAIQSVNLIMTYQGNRIFSSVTPHTLHIWTDSFELDAYEKSAYDYIHANAMANLRPVPMTLTTSSRPTLSSGTAVNIMSDDYDENEDVDNMGRRPSTTASPPPSHSQSRSQSHHESESESEAPVAAAAAAGDTFRITLRSSLGKDIALTVRPTTKCGAIVRAFLKKAGVAEQYPEVFADKDKAAAPPPPPATGTGKRGGRKSNVKAAAPAKDPRLYIDGEKMDNETEIGDELEDEDMVDVVGL